MSKIIIERERVRGPYGDGIGEFDIKLSKDTTVAGFLASIVKDYPQEYGTVYINNKEVCAYSNGELVFYETELDINDYADFFCVFCYKSRRLGVHVLLFGYWWNL